MLEYELGFFRIEAGTVTIYLMDIRWLSKRKTECPVKRCVGPSPSLTSHGLTSNSANFLEKGYKKIDGECDVQL